MKRFKHIIFRFPIFVIPFYFIFRILHGYSVYKALCWQYGEKATWYSAFLPSTGDMFFAATAFPHLRKREGSMNHAVFLAVGKTGAQLTEWFQTCPCSILKERESNNLLRMYRFLNGYLEESFRILHYQPSQMHIGISEALLSYRGMDFLGMLCETSYRGLTKAELLQADTQLFVQGEDKLVVYGLKHGKTVVLSPYANCMRHLSKKFWEELVVELKELGFTVATNCSGAEQAIIGTVRLELPYRELATILKQSGYLIALRSGLVDITYAVPCRRIILYPRTNFNVWGIGSSMDCFSLANMGLREDALELEFEQGHEQALKQNITQELLRWNDACPY